MATTKKSPAAPVFAKIAENKKASFDYFFEERYEAGMVLEGWEVKAIREGKVQLTDGYVVVRNGELFLNLLIDVAVLTVQLADASDGDGLDGRGGRWLGAHQRFWQPGCVQPLQRLSCLSDHRQRRVSAKPRGDVVVAAGMTRDGAKQDIVDP